MASKHAAASGTESSDARQLEAHVVLDQLAFVLRSVAEDAGDVKAPSAIIARRLEELTARIQVSSIEMERIAALVKPNP